MQETAHYPMASVTQGPCGLWRWRCEECGWLGLDLPNSEAAGREAARHQREGCPPAAECCGYKLTPLREQIAAMRAVVTAVGDAIAWRQDIPGHVIDAHADYLERVDHA